MPIDEVVLHNFAGVDTGAPSDKISTAHVRDCRNMIEGRPHLRSIQPRRGSKPVWHTAYPGEILQIAQWVGKDGNYYFGHVYHEPENERTIFSLRKNETARLRYVEDLTTGGWYVGNSFAEDLKTGYSFYIRGGFTADDANFAPDTLYDTWGVEGPYTNYGRPIANTPVWANYSHYHVYTGYCSAIKDYCDELEDYLTAGSVATIGMSYLKDGESSYTDIPLINISCGGGGSVSTINEYVPLDANYPIGMTHSNEVHAYFSLDGNEANQAGWGTTGVLLANLTIDVVNLDVN